MFVIGFNQLVLVFVLFGGQFIDNRCTASTYTSVEIDTAIVTAQQ